MLPLWPDDASLHGFPSSLKDAPPPFCERKSKTVSYSPWNSKFTLDKISGHVIPNNRALDSISHSPRSQIFNCLTESWLIIHLDQCFWWITETSPESMSHIQPLCTQSQNDNSLHRCNFRLFILLSTESCWSNWSTDNLTSPPKSLQSHDSQLF